MWRQLLSRMGVHVHRSLQKQTSVATASQTLVCTHTDGLQSGTLLAAIPSSLCVSPYNLRCAGGDTAAAAALCQLPLTAASETVKLSFTPETVATTIYLARVLENPHHRIHAYMASQVVEQESDASLREKLGARRYAALLSLREAREELLQQLFREASRTSLHVSMGALQRSHALCESRCVDVSGDEDLFEGPALVPFVDLINHRGGMPNVAVYLERPAYTRRIAQRWSSSIAGDFLSDFDSTSPFFTVVRASRDIAVGEELSYPYLGTDDHSHADLLTWAMRFHFIPTEVVTLPLAK